MKKILILLLVSTSAFALFPTGGFLEHDDTLIPSTFSDAEKVDTAGFLKVLLTSKDPEYNTSLLTNNDCMYALLQGHPEVKLKYNSGINSSNRKEDIMGRLMKRLAIKSMIIPAGPAMSKQLLYVMIEFKKRRTIQQLAQKIPVTTVEFLPNDDNHCEQILAEWNAEREKKKVFAEKVRATSYLPFLIRKEPVMPPIDFTKK